MSRGTDSEADTDVEPLERGLSGTEAAEWLARARARLQAAHDVAREGRALFTAARRALGPASLAEFDYDTPFGRCRSRGWDRATAARALLLLDVMARLPQERRAFAVALYRGGEESECVALARALAFSVAWAELKPLALEAGRSNSTAIFSALALDNPFPAAHYDEREFNQLVLKALFLGRPVARVVGLAHRANPELARMCEDYVEEREAAGRPVPGDIWLALAPHASARGREMLARHAGP